VVVVVLRIFVERNDSFVM